MSEIAVLGTGLLGSGFALNMRSMGHNVRVWNRTASKCAPLVEQGCVHANTPGDAVAGADYVHLILAADSSVDSVMELLLPQLPEGTQVIDHSTNLPAGVAERFERLRAAGVRYIHAPVFMGPSNSRAGTGLMLVSGPQPEIEALTPYLQTLTGTVNNLGERPDKAAAVKIIGNSVLLMMSATMGDAFTVGNATGVTPQEVIALFESFSPTPAGMGRRVLHSGDGPVGFETRMARKDVRLMIESAGAESLHLLPAVAAALDDAIDAGAGQQDFAGAFTPR